MSKLFINLINFYQIFLSFDKGILAILAPGGACKYSPSCSEYTKQAIIKYGFIKGLSLGGKRILTCR
ncbi:membrane protein insertion efficiency factor YidD [Candidatus Daviesbacteria bacterium]|nr:membrane protein insertion efficiency factor YidD [Candidatus Daviesbacteria bacterium]